VHYSCNLAFALKVYILLVAAFGIICGIAVWFYPHFSVMGLFRGIAILLLCAMLAVSELLYMGLLDQFSFMRFSPGKGGVCVLVAIIWPDTSSLWIIGVIIFGFTGMLCVIAHFVPALEPAPPVFDLRGGDTDADEARSGYERAVHDETWKNPEDEAGAPGGAPGV